MTSVAPGIFEAFLRMRAITSSAVNFRSFSGLSVTNRRPEFDAPLLAPPTKAINPETSGSSLTDAANCCSNREIDWNDVS